VTKKAKFMQKTKFGEAIIKKQVSDESRTDIAKQNKRPRE
jgi:hypothetical protein